jgi:hypothetical protein
VIPLEVPQLPYILIAPLLLWLIRHKKRHHNKY